MIETTQMKVEVDPEQYEKLRKLMAEAGIEATEIEDENADEAVTLDEVRKFTQAAMGQVQRQAAEALDDLMRLNRVAGEAYGRGGTFTRRDMHRVLNNRGDDALQNVLGRIERDVLGEAPKMNGADPAKMTGGYL